ncbi:hypothetical protein ACI76O_01935 [Capnocytophaga cynodegmi]|uniref:hypothetical protein n=1 Tax=Capnocytophaga cynodegmi TaxID=28189 RepID=UPI001ACD40D9|nr:hypothetical protein [Capnocytophaga cynodegmi]GIM51350.1 hypothetical protein CAPN004_03800 [Capnocytophaga cynodegmi]
MKQTILNELRFTIGDETIDFYVFAERKVPRLASIFFIFFGIFWTIMVLGIGGFDFMEKFGAGGDSFYNTMNAFMIMVSGIFVLVGIGITIWGVVSFFQNGGHFVGTPTRLIHYKKGTTKIYSWSDFTGNVDMNSSKRYITFFLHSNRKVEIEGNMYMICDVINLFSADNILEIERISRQRITENKDSNKFAF